MENFIKNCLTSYIFTKNNTYFLILKRNVWINLVIRLLSVYINIIR